MGVTAALPRSGLHLAFLVANDAQPDHVLYRDERLRAEIDRTYPGRGIYLGREGRLPLHPAKAAAQFGANRRYYRQVREKLEPLGIERLVIFLEGEPLERSILGWFGGDVELWEDGLSHYVDLTGSAWYAARGAIQIASGFYAKGALARRMDRSRCLVRDRFAKGNLHLPSPELAPIADFTLVVGSPLVEDGIIKRGKLVAGLQQLVRASPWPLHYLPHPREDNAELATTLAAIPGVSLAPLPHGIAPHVAAHGYRAYVAPVSTALLDLNAFDRSAFVPSLFGLGNMHKVLAGWPVNPVRTLAEPGDLTSFFERCTG